MSSVNVKPIIPIQIQTSPEQDASVSDVLVSLGIKPDVDNTNLTPEDAQKLISGAQSITDQWLAVTVSQLLSDPQLAQQYNVDTQALTQIVQVLSPLADDPSINPDLQATLLQYTPEINIIVDQNKLMMLEIETLNNLNQLNAQYQIYQSDDAQFSMPNNVLQFSSAQSGSTSQSATTAQDGSSANTSQATDAFGKPVNVSVTLNNQTTQRAGSVSSAKAQAHHHAAGKSSANKAKATNNSSVNKVTSAFDVNSTGFDVQTLNSSSSQSVFSNNSSSNSNSQSSSSSSGSSNLSTAFYVNPVTINPAGSLFNWDPTANLGGLPGFMDSGNIMAISMQVFALLAISMAGTLTLQNQELANLANQTNFLNKVQVGMGDIINYFNNGGTAIDIDTTAGDMSNFSTAFPNLFNVLQSIPITYDFSTGAAITDAPVYWDGSTVLSTGDGNDLFSAWWAMSLAGNSASQNIDSTALNPFSGVTQPTASGAPANIGPFSLIMSGNTVTNIKIDSNSIASSVSKNISNLTNESASISQQQTAYLQNVQTNYNNVWGFVATFIKNFGQSIATIANA